MELHINGFTRHEWYIIRRLLKLEINSLNTAQQAVINAGIRVAFEGDMDICRSIYDRVDGYYTMSGGRNQ